MAVSYKRLWKLLIDKDMKKIELEKLAEISHFTMNQLSHNCNVSTETLGKICKVLDCQIEDIMEFIPDKEIVE